MKFIRFFWSVVSVIALTVSLPNKGCAQFISHFDYEEHSLGWTFSYNNQQMEYRVGEFSDFGNGLWDNGSKRLHGGGMGFIVNGTFGGGFGLYWGLGMELFSSSNESSGFGETIADQYETYMELAFEMPLHLQYKLPIADRIAIGAHVGPGITFSCAGSFMDDDGSYDDVNAIGVENGFKMFNLTFDAALFVELGKLRFDIMWSNGLTDQERNKDVVDKTLRNKLFFGLTILFGDD